ncbi:DHA2 family efflux MFS transporter permease subunit [Citrobacter sedlakii]
MAIKLEVKNLYKVFGEHPQRAFKYIEKGLSKEQILEKTGLSLGVKDASLAIEEGEIFVIMGLSGSGKSTMVRLLNRLIEPTRGQVLIDGVDIAKISEAELREVRRKKIAMVFQSFALMPHMTVLDNTAFGMELAGVSSSLNMLIFFRVVQGIVAGPLIPLSQSLLLNNYPPAKRSIALALWSMTVIVAPICGPILGGYISDNYHWGWIFFINVPIGIAVVLMTLQTLRGRETRTEQRRIDAIGLALLVVGIGSLQIMLDRGKELDWFASQEIIILTVVAVVAISFLIVWELTDDNPIVDLSLFKSRNFTIGCLCISLAYMLYFGAIVLLPQLLQEVYGYTATWAGLASAPVGIIPVILSPIIGRFAHKLDMRRLVTFSFIMYAVCFYWRAYTFEPGMDFGASAWPQFIQGFAVACFFMPLTTITLSGLPPERLAAASSLSNFTRTLAGSIGTSITTTLWTNRESMHHAQLTESVNPYNPNAQAMYDQLQGMGMTQQQASGWIAQQITNQGLIISANEIFWMSAGIFLILLGLVWFAKPPFGAGGGGGGAH